LKAIDLRSGDIVHWLNIQGIVEEFYDVAVLPGVVRPTALGFKSDEIRRVITIGRLRPWIWRAAADSPTAHSIGASR
jgi:hypothetical protein